MEFDRPTLPKSRKYTRPTATFNIPHGDILPIVITSLARIQICTYLFSIIDDQIIYQGTSKAEISSISIGASVGRIGRNNKPDVTKVQGRLNDLMIAPRKLLVVDGIGGWKTRSMIADFQKNAADFRWPDGRVDTGGRTLNALNDKVSAEMWAGTSNSTIPVVPGNEDDGKGDPPRRILNPIEEAMDEIRNGRTLSATEEKVYRAVITAMWEAEKNNLVSAGGTLTPAGSKMWLTVAKGSVKGVGSLIMSEAAMGTALMTAGVSMVVLGIVISIVGSLMALDNAMETDERVYEMVGRAYATTAWAKGRGTPKSSPNMLNRIKSVDGEHHDPEDFERAWTKGTTAAWAAISRALEDKARKAGVAKTELTRQILTLSKKDDSTKIAKSVMRDLAKQLRNRDPYVAIQLEAHSKSGSWSYPG